MELLRELFIFLGRVGISTMFLWGAWEKITHWKETLERMEKKHFPNPKLMLPCFVAFKIIGGLMVLVGWYSHFGAFLLLLVTIPGVIWQHAFWKETGPHRQLEKAFFRREVAIIGALLLILAIGAGRFALRIAV